MITLFFTQPAEILSRSTKEYLMTAYPPVNPSRYGSVRRSILLIILFCGFLAHSARAISLVSTNEFNLPEGAILENETWIGCEKAVVSGVLKNDLFLAAQNAQLNGSYEMDLWAAAQEIVYAGTCAGHVRLTAKSISFSGSAQDNVICAASTVDITSDAQITGDVLLFAENALFQGQLNGELTIYATSVTLGGVINGSIRIYANDIVVMPSAVIEGDLKYLSTKDLFLDSSVKLGGSLEKIQIIAAPVKEKSWSDAFLYQAFFYMSALIAGLVWIFLFPTLSMCAVSATRESMLKCFLIGLAVLFGIPAILMMLFVSLLGIPLALLLTVAYASLIYVAKVISAYTVGLMVLRRASTQPLLQNAFTVLSAGMLCIYLPAVVPSLSFFIWILTTCCGLGALVLALFRLRNREKLLITIANNTPQPENTPDSKDA